MYGWNIKRINTEYTATRNKSMWVHFEKTAVFGKGFCKIQVTFY